jgi:hypothetical protein
LNKFTKLTLKVLLWIIGGIVGLILLAFVLIRIPAVQNFAIQKVVNYLENKIGTKVRLQSISLDLPKLLVLEGVYFEDQKQDTLFAGEILKVDISLLKLLNNKVEINELDFRGITANVVRSLPDSAYNFDYIIRAFVTEDAQSKSNDTSSAMTFSIDKINLDRIKIIYKDDILGTSATLDLKHADTRIKTFDLAKMYFEIPKINVNGFNTVVKQWAVAELKEIPSTSALGVEQVVDEDQPTDIRIGKLDLKNFNIQYEDAMAEMKAKLIFKTLQLDFNELNLPKENIDINKFVLEDTDASVTFAKAQKEKTDTSSTSESLNWVVKANSIDLKRNHIVYDDNNSPVLKKGMDYSHLDISNLDAFIKNLYFSIDSISGDVNTLNFKDKSGLEIRKLQTLFSYTDQGASLNDLYLETPNTIIRDHIKVAYPSIEGLAEHPENIVLNASIKNSKLGMKDVILLVPDLDTMQVMQPLLTNTFLIDGNIRGRVDNLTLPALRVRTRSTRLNASGSIRGLPNIDRLQLNLDIKDFTSTNGDLANLIDKSLLPDSIELPENVHLYGTFIGGMEKFNTNLHLESSIGNANLDGAFLLGKTDTLYDAQIDIADFDLGKLMQDTTYGKITFNADVKGKSLDPKNAVANLQANLIRADFMGYSYSGINLNAQASGGNMTATIVSNDPSLKLNGDVKADMSGQYPSAELSLTVDSIKLKNLNFTQDDIKYQGQLEGNFTTANPDFLNGHLYVVNSLLSYNGDVYPIDSISLTSEASDSFNLINLESEFLNAHLVGNYKLTELATAIQDVMASYYNPEQTSTTKEYSPQSFEFSAELNRSPLIENMLPALTEMNNITLDGNFSSAEKSINARLAAPHILYNGMLIDTVVFDLNTADTTIFYAGRIGEVKISTVQIINTLISGTVKNNLLDFGLWIKDSIDREQYHLGVNILAKNKDFIFNLKPDGLILNYDKWTIAPNNQINFGQNGIIANDFLLTNKGQLLSLNSQDSILNSPLDVKFTNFRIETFTKFLETNTLKLGGGINGTVLVDRLESKPTFVTDLTVNQFYFGNDTIGDINMKVNNTRENIYAADVTIIGEGNDVNLKGDFINPPTGSSSLDFILNMNNLNMTTLEAFSFGNLQHSSGAINGKLSIKGTTNAPLINGDLLFNKAQTNVSMLNALFLFDQQRITFDNQGLRFNKFEVADSTGNKAILNGAVQTKTYTDFLMNLTLNANNFQVVNSTAKDNDLFYGKLFVTSNLKIQGTATSPKVDGTLKVNENTNFSIVIPDENPGLVDREGIVEFIDKKRESKMQAFIKKDSVTTPTVTGMDVSFNIEVDPKATFNIIIDPGSGDAVTAKGKAELTAGIDPSGKMTLAGTYEVSEGSYNLSFNFLNRRFDFRKGSTITWTGDPFTADLDITADYLINASSIDLVENQLSDQNKNLYKEKLPFQVNLFIKGEMMKPSLTFGIDVDEDRASVSQDVMSLVNTRLAQISEDESELNKQVFALIVLGRFVAENPFSSSAGGSVESMARESVSKLLSAQLNRLAGDLIAGVELDFDLESTDDYSTGSLQSRTDLNVGISKRLLDDRLKVTIGSNFEIEGANQPGRQPTNIAGDIAVDYQLSRDGRYLLRAYRKNQYEVTLQGQVIETGIGFIINMNYDVFRELFLGTKALERYKRRLQRRERRKYLDRPERPTQENGTRIRRYEKQTLRNEKQNEEK